MSLLSRTYDRLKSDPIDAGERIVRLDQYQNTSYASMAFLAAHGHVGLLKPNTTLIAYTRPARIYTLGEQDRWTRVDAGAGGEAFYSRNLLSQAQEMLETGDFNDIPNLHDTYTSTMAARRELLWNGTDEQVSNLDETHPIPKNTIGLPIDRDFHAQLLAEAQKAGEFARVPVSGRG